MQGKTTTSGEKPGKRSSKKPKLYPVTAPAGRADSCPCSQEEHVDIEMEEFRDELIKALRKANAAANGE